MARNQSTTPNGIRRVSEGYPKGLTGRDGALPAVGRGGPSVGAGENSLDSVGPVAPTVDLLHDTEDDPRTGPRLTIVSAVPRGDVTQLIMAH